MKTRRSRIKPRRDPMRCEVFEITGWNNISIEKKQAISRIFQELDTFFGQAPFRRGFSGINKSHDGNTIIGFYVQEDLREGLEGSSPDQLKRQERANFESLFFGLVVDVGHVIIQRTTISGYLTLNYTTMRRDFENTLIETFKLAGLDIIQLHLQKFFRQRTQEEMFSIFIENIVLEVEVSDLMGKKVRENVQLSNPDPSEEIFLRRIFDGDFQKIESESIKAADGQDLRKTKSAKAAVGAGHTQKIVVKRSTNETETFYTEQDEKLDVPIDDQKSQMSDKDVVSFIEVYERKIKIPVSKMPPKITDLGPIFAWNKDE